MFVFIVRNCTRIRKLALRMINELVEKNEVYNAEKIDGKWAQRLRIYYNCVGGNENIPGEPHTARSCRYPVYGFDNLCLIHKAFIPYNHPPRMEKPHACLEPEIPASGLRQGCCRRGGRED